MLMSLEDQGLQEISLERNFHKVWVSGPQPWVLLFLQATCAVVSTQYHDLDGPGWEGQSVELWLGRKDSCELEGPLNPPQACQGNSVTEWKILRYYWTPQVLITGVLFHWKEMWYAKFPWEKKTALEWHIYKFSLNDMSLLRHPADYGLLPGVLNLEKWLLYHIITIFWRYPTYDNEDLVRSSGQPERRIKIKSLEF